MNAVPTERFRPLVDAWLAHFETPEDGYHALARNGIKPDTWRKRLSEKEDVGSGGQSLHRGWYASDYVDFRDVDEFLVAADMVELWHTELADLYECENGDGNGRGKARPLPGQRCRIPEKALRKLHVFHVEKFVSLGELGRRAYETYGYATPKSAQFAISAGWRGLGLQAH